MMSLSEKLKLNKDALIGLLMNNKGSIPRVADVSEH